MDWNEEERERLEQELKALQEVYMRCECHLLEFRIKETEKKLGIVTSE